MWCLWNGEYGEHDIAGLYSTKSCSEKNIERMEAEYKKWPGTVVGDFTCEKVEYDWGRRDQRWTVKCNLCGKVMYQYHAKDWRRGNGRKTTCDCRKEREIEAREKAKKDSLEKIAARQKEHLGKIYGDWKVIEYKGGVSCVVECVVCGKIKKSDIRIDDVVGLKLNPCNHRSPVDYSGEEWIGKRNGHLTAVGRDGNRFIVRCDCGREITVRPTELFTRKTKTTCGDPDCNYSSEREKVARKKRVVGHEYEKETLEMLISRGYNAELTKCYSDFGVDIVITNTDGTKIAVQCKKQATPVGVSAIQEVYAGGRFYGCTKFSVICERGFSNPAIIMARELGVYLCEGEFNYPSDIEDYAKSLLPAYHSNERLKKLYEIDGESKTLSDWCVAYGISEPTVRSRVKSGCSLKAALETPTRQKDVYTVQGITGTKSELCDYFSVSMSFVDYRMNKCGMSLSDAITTPKKTLGRPKKKQPATVQSTQVAPYRNISNEIQYYDTAFQLKMQGF